MTDIPQSKNANLNDVILSEDLTIPGSKKSSDWITKIFTSPAVSMSLTAFLMIFLFGASFFIAYKMATKPKIIQTYEDCTKSRGSLIRESYPAICVTKDGKEFIQPLSEEEQKLLEAPLNETSNNSQNTPKCKPKFAIESGPELTASQVYSQECTGKTTKEDCEKVDIYRTSTQNFGNSDGVPDCEWQE